MIVVFIFVFFAKPSEGINKRRKGLLAPSCGGREIKINVQRKKYTINVTESTAYE